MGFVMNKARIGWIVLLAVAVGVLVFSIPRANLGESSGWVGIGIGIAGLGICHRRLTT